MKSVDGERRRARRFLVVSACSSVIIGFIACSGSTEHRAVPQRAVAGDDAGGAAHAGASGFEQGGSQSAQAGDAPVVAGTPSDGGVVGVAGHSAGGAGGESTGGVAAESTGGVGGAGGDATVVDPVCGVNMVKVGEYSLWCGKVNEHTDGDGLWQPDADCSSGCNVSGATYCKKFYPNATTVVSVPQVVAKDWKNAGCDDSTPDGPGISGQAACCAPIE